VLHQRTIFSFFFTKQNNIIHLEIKKYGVINKHKEKLLFEMDQSIISKQTYI
jgi:hypothetical protein